MKTALRSLLFASVLAVAAHGQVPAPDFDVYAAVVDPNVMVVVLHVQGPPSTPVGIYYTLDNPYTTPPALITVGVLATVQTDASGMFQMNVPIFGQDPLPDLWCAAVLFPTNGPAIVPSIMGLSGSFGYASVAPWFGGTKSSDHSFRVAGQTIPGHTISVWKTNGPCPSIGDTFSTAGSGTTYEGGTVTDPSTGDYVWNGTIDPPGCIVVCETMSDGTLQVIARKQAE